MQNFDFEVEYKTGTLLHLADTLSRAYLPHGQVKCSKEDVFLTVDVRSPIEQEVESVSALNLYQSALKALPEFSKQLDGHTIKG